MKFSILTLFQHKNIGLENFIFLNLDVSNGVRGFWMVGTGCKTGWTLILFVEVREKMDVKNKFLDFQICIHIELSVHLGCLHHIFKTILKRYIHIGDTYLELLSMHIMYVVTHHALVMIGCKIGYKLIDFFSLKWLYVMLHCYILKEFQGRNSFKGRECSTLWFYDN